MSTFSNAIDHRLAHWQTRLWEVTNVIALTMLSVLFQLTACSQAQKPPQPHVDRFPKAATLSLHRLLGPSDYAKFQVGRSKIDTLNDVQWRGNFEMGCLHQGKSIVAVSFELFSDKLTGNGGEVVWAIFHDNKFEKFVRWPAWETIDIPYHGTTRSVYKPITLGDFQRLLDAADSKSVSIEELKRDMKSRGKTPTQIDPGLTVAFLLAQVITEGQIGASKADVEKNASLRDQFNAARLAIGMTKDDVEKQFRVTPLRSGKFPHGSFAIYGSKILFDILPQLQYSNVLALYENGKVSGIYSGETVPGGDQGLKTVQAIVPELKDRLQP